MKYEAFPTRGDESRWTKAVWIRLGYGTAEAVRSPSHALEQLSHRWPAQRGPLYVAAKAQCLAACSAIGPSGAAREAFERACIEARLHAAGDLYLWPRLETINRNVEGDGDATYTPQV